MACCLSIAATVIEDRYRTGTWVCSLPVSRKDVVLARYFSALIVIAGCLSLYLIYGSLLQLLIPRHTFFRLYNTGILLTLLLAPLLLASLYLPFYFRYGFSGGAFRLLIWTVAFFCAISIVVHLTSGLGRLAEYFSSQALLAGALQSLMRAVRQHLQAIGPFIVFLLIVIFIGVFVYGSFRLSLRFFIREEL